MTSIRRYQPWRLLVRALLILFAFGLPFVRVQGESAFRFDVPSITLHAFGSRIAMDEFFLVLLSILILSFLIILVTILFGRIWCGWLCPQTVIADLTRFADQGAKRDRNRRIKAAVVMFPLSALLAADILWYFVSPYDFFRQMTSGEMHAVIGWSWLALTSVTFLNFLFLRRGFCATVCPYAKMQGVLYDEKTLVITMDPERSDECMACDACVRTCPVGIDVRKGVQASCINCAECIDACADRMERRSKPSLIGYRFGVRGENITVLRRGVLFSAAGTILFLALFVYLFSVRSKIELLVLPDTRSAPRISSDGNLVNLYVLSITNRTDADATLAVQAIGGHRELHVIPDQVRVQKNGHERVMVAIKTLKGFQQGEKAEIITISVVSETDRELFAQQKIKMFPPPVIP